VLYIEGDCSKMKLLMESWRSFLKENKEEYLKTLGLHVETSEDGEFTVSLFDLQERNPQIVGTIGTMEMADTDGGRKTPCIPKTQEIGSVAVDSKYKSKGIGTYLYEVASVLVWQISRGGITSDHSASTTKDAAPVWKKLVNKLGYLKRSTSSGNEDFDYDDSTPDPDDDCYLPSDGKPASDHSLMIPPDRMEKIGEIMEIQMQNYENMTDSTNINVGKESSSLFQKEYKPDESGIYGDD
jgi:GNAT superfamily N-acetyltransferase